MSSVYPLCKPGTETDASYPTDKRKKGRHTAGYIVCELYLCISGVKTPENTRFHSFRDPVPKAQGRFCPQKSAMAGLGKAYTGLNYPGINTPRGGGALSVLAPEHCPYSPELLLFFVDRRDFFTKVHNQVHQVTDLELSHQACVCQQTYCSLTDCQPIEMSDVPIE